MINGISQLTHTAECAVPIEDTVKALNEYSHANPRTDAKEVANVISRVANRINCEFVTLRLNQGFGPLDDCDAVNATFGHSAAGCDPTQAPGVQLIADFQSYCEVLGLNDPSERPYLLHRCAAGAFKAIMRRGLLSPAMLAESHPRDPWATMFCPLSPRDVEDAINVDCLAAVDLIIDVRQLIEDSANFDPPIELYYAPGPAFFVPGKVPGYMVCLARLNGRGDFMTPTQLTRQSNFLAADLPDHLAEGGGKGGCKGQKGADNSNHPLAAGNALFKRNECKFFLQGKCTKRVSCPFFHDPDDRAACRRWPDAICQIWHSEQEDKARRERGRPKVQQQPAASALARGSRSASSQARAVAFPADPADMEVEITDLAVKTEDDPVPDTLLDKVSLSSGGHGTPLLP